MRDHKELFSHIYAKNVWGNGSGSGSGPKYCLKYMKLLQKLIKKKKIKNVLDLGCGDWQFSQYMDWGSLDSYVGLDVVSSVVERNKEMFGKKNIAFHKCDISNVGKIEPFFGKEEQLVIIKDVLMHWKNEEIENWIHRVMKLPFRYLLVTNSWKYFRKPENNLKPRVLDPKYSWAPIDALKPPIGDYRPKVLLTFYSKQVALIKGSLK